MLTKGRLHNKILSQFMLQLQIIKGLNPEQYSPNTILPNNSKASVLVNFGVGYNFEL